MKKEPLSAELIFHINNISDERGWVEHDPEEIYANTLQVVKNLIEKAGINKKKSRTWNQQSERNRSCLGPQNRKAGVQCCCVAVCKRKRDLQKDRCRA